MLAQVWRHPNNADRRARAVAGAVAWQASKRVLRRPRVVRLTDTLRIECHPTSASGSNVIYFGKLFDPVEMTFLRRYLRPGDGFIDGGANIGVYSLLAASSVGPTGAVLAFEPDATSRAWLERNIELNGLSSVEVRSEALWDTAEVLRFREDVDVSNRIELDTSTGVEVSTVRLDDVAAGGTWALGKLDLEGAELRALQGATSMLAAANPPVWQVEVFEHLLRRVGSSRAALLELLRDHRYDVVRCVDHEPVPDDFRGNALAIARDRADEVHQRLQST